PAAAAQPPQFLGRGNDRLAVPRAVAAIAGAPSLPRPGAVSRAPGRGGLMRLISLLWVLAVQAAAPVAPVVSYPFAVGEKLSYSAKLGMLTLGSGTLEVASIDTVRGVESFRFRFRLRGKTMFYSLDDVLE